MITEAQGRALARYARAVVDHELGGPKAVAPAFRGAGDPAATFVTIHDGARLHGCMGTLPASGEGCSLVASRALAEDVAANAYAAAFVDPRARPLSRADLPSLGIEVTLLGPLEPIACVARLREDDAVAALRPGVDGVVLEAGDLRATFLPQVWRSLPDPRAFLRALKVKAGLSEDAWGPAIALSRFDARVFVDPPYASVEHAV